MLEDIRDQKAYKEVRAWYEARATGEMLAQAREAQERLDRMFESVLRPNGKKTAPLILWRK